MHVNALGMYVPYVLPFRSNSPRNTIVVDKVGGDGGWGVMYGHVAGRLWSKETSAGRCDAT